MTIIQSSTGLITGIDIEGTVEQLMAVARQPRTALANRTSLLSSEKLAISQLSSLVLAFQFEVNRLTPQNLFETKTVTSTDQDVLAAVATDGGNPPAGSHTFRALQTAASQQLVSNSFDSLDDLATEGILTIGFGGFVDKGISLDQLNGGEGFVRGQIRITDRDGNIADVDLRLAQTVDDVLDAINNNTDIDVTAVVTGDRFKLIDNTGGAGNLKVSEIGGGTTAASLGLADIDVAADEATGTDVYSLHTDTRLSLLNDGTGVQIHSVGDDLEITFADETSITVALGGATTLGDVIDALNAASPTKLTAEIAADGNRLELNDLTSGAGTFAVSSVGTGTAAEDLGLTVAADLGTITGDRLVAGLRDTLVSSLRGGDGLGTLGQVDITNRNGVLSEIDLSDAETLADVVDAINDQATGVTAAVNSVRNGILLTDTTGATTSNLIVADGDANESATALGIVVDDSVTSVNSGTLSRQQISKATLLSSLNNGDGIDLGDFYITDSNGNTSAVDLNSAGSEAETVGDVIDRINALSTINVEARINDTGDGILLEDLASGPNAMHVTEVGTHTTAADLGLLGYGVDTTIDGSPAHVIDGSSAIRVDLSDLGDPGASIALTSLNNGDGVSLGAFRITDTNGLSAVVVLNAAGSTFDTVADVIDAINATSIGVEASIDDSGTGIILVDTAGGAGTLAVEDLAGGTTAADLGIDGDAVTVEIEGTPTQVIDGIGTFSQSATASGLAALAAQINSREAGVTASTLFDGQGYRLVITADNSGTNNQVLVDGLDAGLSFEQISAARDAILEFGGAQEGSGMLITSSTDTFENVLTGVELTIEDTSSNPVTINIAVTDATLISTMEDFVDAFNSIRDKLDELTNFDEEAMTTGILFGTTAALRVEQDLNNILSGSFYGLGNFTSLESIGIGFDDTGHLELDSSKLEEAFANDPDGLETLLTHDTLGLAARLDSAIEMLAGSESSVLSTRADTLTDKIDTNNDRLDFMDERLEREEARLLAQFYLLETTIAQLQQNLTALEALTIIPPLTSTSSD
jgi:flagellar hook-associated protein 2